MFAGLLRIARLGAPSGRIFDEFYAVDACFYLFGPTGPCETRAEITSVHPPLGKWLIAAGIRVVGNTPTGWRIASVVAGTATVAVLYLLARELFRSRMTSVVASGLLAIDPLHFVMSRMAMLDVFVTFFATSAVLFLSYDRRRLLASEHRRTGVAALRDRPWRVAAGAAAGAAAACKWSGWFALLTIVVVSLAWERSARRRNKGSPGGRWRAVAREEGPSLAVGFVVVPVLVYAATFAGRLDGSILALPWAEDSWIRAFVSRQVSMARFHLPLAGAHPYASPPWSWLLLKRPVSFFLTQTSQGRYDQVMAVGSPVVWWASILALAHAAIAWVRRRTFERPYGLILAGFLGAYVPWFLLATSRSQTFIFYLLPAVPFMCLAVAGSTMQAARTVQGKALTAGLLAATIAWFGFSYPVLAAVALPEERWMHRMLFHDCNGVTLPGQDPPARPPPTSTQSSETFPEATSSSSEGVVGVAPDGWCWI